MKNSKTKKWKGEVSKINFFREIETRPYHTEEEFRENPQWRMTSPTITEWECRVCGKLFETYGMNHADVMFLHLDDHINAAYLGYWYDQLILPAKRSKSKHK